MTNNNKPKSALIAYCALAQRLNQSGVGITQALIPFFEEACQDLTGQLFDAEKFSVAVLQRFGFSIPRLAALGLAEQLSTAGLLAVVSNSGGKTVYKHISTEQSQDQVSPITEAQVEKVLVDFAAYCAEDAKLVNLGRVDLDEAFLDRLLNIDSMRILGRKEASSAVKKNASTLLLGKSNGRIDANSIIDLHLDFKTSQFLLDLQVREPAAFDLVSDIAFANMAAETIACFQESADANEPLNGLTVYLDSPILLDMLGVNNDYVDYGTELLETINRSGAKAAVFDHCVIEAETAISAQLVHLRSGINSRAHRWGTSAKPDLLNALKDNVGTRAYQRLGIEIERDPDNNLHRRAPTIVGDIESEMNDRMQHWGKDDAKEHDRKSVWSMLSIRDSTQPCPRICDSKWIFLSRNTALVTIANNAWARWLRGTTKHSTAHVDKWAPISMSDKQFAGYVWARTGGSGSNMPRARLLANCSAAVRPRSDIKARAYNLLLELDGKQAADDIAALLEDREGARALMKATSGDPEDVTVDRMPYIVEQVKLAAGEFAAAREREKNEIVLLERSAAYQKEIDHIRQDAIEAEEKQRFELAAANAAKLQADQEREALEMQKKHLLEQLALQSKADLNRTIEIFVQGFKKGANTFTRLKWEVAILFSEFSVLAAQISSDDSVLSWSLSFALPLFGFWFVPEYLNGPLNYLANRVAIDHILQSDGKIDLPATPADFREEKWSAIEELRERVNNIM